VLKKAFLSGPRQDTEARLRALAARELDTSRQYAYLRAADSLASPVGKATFWAAKKAPEAALATAASLGDYVLTPATKAGPVVDRGLRALMSRTDIAVPALGAALVAPTIIDAAKNQYYQHLEETNKMVNEPGSVRIAHEITLNEFMLKVAAKPGESLGSLMTSGVSKGLGESFGKGLVERLFTSAGSAIGKILDTPARKEIMNRLMTSDPIISDAVKRNPQMQRQLLEAFGTMIKFAPSLTTDINAVRSFLREVVLGGGNVNYAVVKNLIDTEKSHRK
jgi:hypothetical protein